MALDPVIYALFSEALDAASVTTASFTMTSASGACPGVAGLAPQDPRVARFYPNVSLDYGTAYTLTCTTAIRSVSGRNLRVSFSWSFTTIPAPPPEFSWEPAVEVESIDNDIPDTYSDPDISIDDDESACAVWRQSDGSSYRIWARRSDQGSDWDTPIAIDSGSGSPTSPAVAVNGGGILAVWSTGSAILCRRAAMTGGWGPIEQVAIPASPPAVVRQLIMDEAGNAFVFYYETGNNNLVSVVRFDNQSGAWGSIEPLPMPHAELRQVAMHRPSGFAVMTWRNLAEILGRRYLPGSGWTETEVLASWDPDLRPVNGFLTVSSDGTCVATWMRQRNPGLTPALLNDREILISRCSASATWGVPEPGPGTVNQWVGGAVPGFALDGTLMVAWSDQVDRRCYTSRQATPGEWTYRVGIDLDLAASTGCYGSPIGGLVGRFTVVGMDTLGSGSGNIWANEFDPDTGWESPTLIRAAGGYIGGFKVVGDSMGRAAAIWLEAQGPSFNGGNDIWCARYR